MSRPVFVAGLLDGGGSHFIQIGAFLSPLSKGTHTVTIRATLDGAALGGAVFSFFGHLHGDREGLKPLGNARKRVRRMAPHL